MDLFNSNDSIDEELENDYDDDCDVDVLITPPTRVMQCFNKDGSINIFKYIIYRRQKKYNNKPIDYQYNQLDLTVLLIMPFKITWMRPTKLRMRVLIF
jgi:hypothetical protein